MVPFKAKKSPPEVTAKRTPRTHQSWSPHTTTDTTTTTSKSHLFTTAAAHQSNKNSASTAADVSTPKRHTLLATTAASNPQKDSGTARSLHSVSIDSYHQSTGQNPHRVSVDSNSSSTESKTVASVHSPHSVPIDSRRQNAAQNPHRVSVDSNCSQYPTAPSRTHVFMEASRCTRGDVSSGSMSSQSDSSGITNISMVNRDGSGGSSRRISSSEELDQSQGSGDGLKLQDCDDEEEDYLGGFPLTRPGNPVRTNGLSIWKTWR